MRRPSSTNWLWLVAVMTILPLAACQPTPETQPMITLTTDKPEDSASVVVADGRAVIDVTSISGIGGLQAVRAAGDWPAEVVVRLHTQGLEQLEIAYGAVVLATGVSSTSEPGPPLTLYVIDESGEVEQASPSSDIYYPTITPVTAGDATAVIPLQNGYFEIVLPAHFNQTDPDSFTLQWIDFYR